MGSREFTKGLNSLLSPEESSDEEKKNKVTEKTKRGKKNQFIKVNVMMTERQKKGLDDLTRKIMISRRSQEGVKKERITPSSIVRSLIDSLLSKSSRLDTSGINNEEELSDRVSLVSGE